MKKLEILLFLAMVLLVLALILIVPMNKERERFAGEEHVRMEKKYGDTYSL